MRLGVLGLMLASIATAQASSPKFTLVQTTLILPPGATSQTLTLTIEGSDLPSGNFKPILVDEKTPAWPSVRIETKFLDSNKPSAGSQLWHFQVTVADFPAAESQSRIFTISYGDHSDSLPYTLTNVGSKSFTWSVKLAPEWNLSSMDALPFAIQMGDLPASAVTLNQADFTSDDKLKKTIAKQDFQLCPDAPPADCSPAAIVLQARNTSTLYLRPKGDLPFGTFKGNVSIQAAEKKDPDVFAVTIYSPRPWGWIWATGFLALGVAISALLQFGLRSFTRNREERQVVLLLRAQLARLNAEFDQLPPNLQKAAAEWTNRSEKLKQDLADETINPLLRPVIPQPYESEVTQLETFKSTMEANGASFSHLRLLLRSGLEIIAAMQNAHPGHDQDMENTAEEISELPPANADTEITKLLAALRTKTAIPAPAKLAAAPRATPQSELHSINVQLLTANFLAWIFWGVVSVLSGLLLLVFQNPGFGTELDLLLCLAWGLGISVAGAQSSQMTPSTIAGSLGIKLPGGK